MTHASLTIIRQEHRALSAMLRSTVLLLDEHRRRDTLPDFGALRAMLFYVDEFPEKLHHPKESQLLFESLRRRSAQADAILERLDREHARGEQAIRELEHLLLGLEVMSDTDQRAERYDAFHTTFSSYVRFYLEHMHIEEREVLPLAEELLDAGDWEEIDAAFLTNRDPLVGYEADEAYRPLFKKILDVLGRSNGVGANIGSVLEALSGTAPPKFPGGSSSSS